jgi:hypothetical protein
MREHSGGMFSRTSKYSFNCSVIYYLPNGEAEYRSLSELDEVLPFNPFQKAIGQLGAAEWELVSMQHGTDNALNAGEIRWSNSFAYFKRPCIPGRAVNEPKLSI